MPIIWRNHYAVDGAGIDEEHRQLVRLYNRLEADAADNPVALTAGLEAFRSASRQHFRRKERLQHMARFPRVEDHRLHHVNLLERLDDIIAGVEAAGAGEPAAAPLGELRHWLLDHILKYDLALKPYAALLRAAAENI